MIMKDALALDTFVDPSDPDLDNELNKLKVF